MTIDTILEHGLYAGVTLTLFICGIGVPLPEEGVFLAAGWYGAKHEANVWVLCVCGVLGILLGDSIPYWMGRTFGLRVLKKRPFSWFMKEKGIEKTRCFFGKNGSKTIFVGRFLAGLRMPVFFMAGSMHVPYWRFLLWDLSGALISCPTSIWLAYRYGPKAEGMLRESKPVLFGALAIIVLYTIYHFWAHREKPVDCVASVSTDEPVTLPLEHPIARPKDIPITPKAKTASLN